MAITVTNYNTPVGTVLCTVDTTDGATGLVVQWVDDDNYYFFGSNDDGDEYTFTAYINGSPSSLPVPVTPQNDDTLKVVIAEAEVGYVYNLYVNDALETETSGIGFDSGFMGYKETGTGAISGFSFSGEGGGGGSGGQAVTVPFKVTVLVDLVATQGLTVTLMSSENPTLADSTNLPVLTDSNGQANFFNTSGTYERHLQVSYLGDIYKFKLYTGTGENRVNISTPQLGGDPLPITYKTKVTVQNAADNSAIANAAVYWSLKENPGVFPNSYLPIHTAGTVLATTNASGIAFISTTAERVDGFCIVAVSGFTPRVIEATTLAADYVVKLDAKPAMDGNGTHALVVCMNNGAPAIRTPTPAFLNETDIALLIQSRYPYEPRGQRQPLQAGSAVEYNGQFQTFGDMVFWLTTTVDDDVIVSGPVQGNDFNCAVLHCQPSTSYHLWMSSPFIKTDPSPAEVTTGAGRTTKADVEFIPK